MARGLSLRAMSISNRNDNPPGLLWFGALLILLGFAVLARIATADDDDTPTATQVALALDVARTAVNEASLRAGSRDVAMIYEATRYHGDDDASRLAWLRLHSRCTNPAGDCNRDGRIGEADYVAAEARPGNAGWTRYLEWNDDEPANFSPRLRWRPERWAEVRALALARVMADEPTRVCGVPIRTWGSRADFANRDPGGRLVAVECGARNLGGTTPALAASPRARRVRRSLSRPLAFEVEVR